MTTSEKRFNEMLQKEKKVRRKCLCCSTSFISLFAGNRLCGRCHAKKTAALADPYYLKNV